VPADLLLRRPDVRGALDRVRAADAAVAAAVADRFPSLRLTGAVGVSRTLLDAGTAAGAFWNLLAGLTQPIVDGGRRLAEVDRTEAVTREAVAGFRQALLTAVAEVEDALSDNRTTEQQVRRLEDRVAVSEDTLRAATDRYFQGLSDYLTVLTSQALLFDARRDLLAARRQLLSDRVALVRAVGGSWMDAEADRRFAERGGGDGG
jgi:outer membrane protein TolC